MHAFTRIAGFVFLFLSLSFLVSALPTPRTLSHISSITGTDAISCVLAKLIVELESKMNALVGSGSIGELYIAMDAVVALVTGCSSELKQLGAGVAVTAEAKASIVACICSIFALCVQVCAQISAKFGFLVLFSLYAKLDLCLYVLLRSLDLCIGGMVKVIAHDLAAGTLGVLGKFQFKMCLGLFGYGGLGF